MSENNFVLTLTVGDWSDDGHGQTSIHVYISNKNHKEVKEAYKNGSDKLGFDFREECCRQYEENYVYREHLEKLIEFGLSNDEKLSNLDMEKGSWKLSIDNFVETWVFICRLGDPSLIIEKAVTSNINIGGYGLFRC